MKKLLKSYGFTSDMQYYEMILDSIMNGQISQAKSQFLALSRADRKSFVISIHHYWATRLTTYYKEMFINLI